MFYNNKSLDRALQILSAFNAEQPNFTLAELSEAVHVPKATVLRLCSTLVHHDFLAYKKEMKKYALGLKLFRARQCCLCVLLAQKNCCSLSD